MMYDKISIVHVERNALLPRFVYFDEANNRHQLSHSEAVGFIKSLMEEIEMFKSISRRIISRLGFVDRAICEILGGRTDEVIRHHMADLARTIADLIGKFIGLSPVDVEASKDYLRMLHCLFPEVFIDEAYYVAKRQLKTADLHYADVMLSLQQQLESFVDSLWDKSNAMASIKEDYDIAFAAFMKRSQLRAQRKQKRAAKRARRYARKGTAKKVF